MAELIVIAAVVGGIVYYWLSKEKRGIAKTGRKSNAIVITEAVNYEDLASKEYGFDRRYPFTVNRRLYAFILKVNAAYPALLTKDEKNINAFTVLYALCSLGNEQKKEWIEATIYDLELETAGLTEKEIRKARLYLKEIGALEEQNVGKSRRVLFKLDHQLLSEYNH